MTGGHSDGANLEQIVEGPVGHVALHRGHAQYSRVEGGQRGDSGAAMSDLDKGDMIAAQPQITDISTASD